MNVAKNESGTMTMTSPKVSVAMPVYNSEKYLAKAVESILAQTFTDFEFLIVDDGSTDASRAILEQYSARDPRIKLVSRPNTGYLVALNEMLERARGQYVARMDADDVALPERFERQVQYLDDHPECVLLASRVIIIDPDGDPLQEMGYALTHEEIDGAFMNAQGQVIYHPSVMYRRRVVLELGCYRPEYYLTEDLDLFLRLAEIGRVASLAEPLLLYREHLHKIGYRRLEQQEDVSRRTLIDAYKRRGKVLPAGTLERFNRRLANPLDTHRTWAWWALMAGHVATARKHAWSCLRLAPLSVDSWRLFYCALRVR
jgi:glycosyltransferase involved in cell wall biosynthesis